MTGRWWIPLAQWSDLIQAAAPPTGRALVAGLLYTGARLGTVARLRVTDVDQENETLWLTVGEGREPRDLHPTLASQLRRLVGGRTRGPLFASRRGGALCDRQLRRLVWHAGQCAGFRQSLSPESLRASFAAVLWERSDDLDLLQETLGHSELWCTRRYLRSLGLL